MYGGSQVMNSQIRRGEQFLFAKNGSYRMHQRIGFFNRRFLSLRCLRMDGFPWKGGMRRYIADTAAMKKRVIVRLTRGSERSPYHRMSRKTLQKKQSIIGSEMIHWYNMYACFPLFVNHAEKLLLFF